MTKKKFRYNIEDRTAYRLQKVVIRVKSIIKKDWMAKRKQKSGKIAGFIIKLIDILKNKENEDIIFYNEHERSFTIKNIRKFTEQILPKYFKHKNYSSFVRQVNLYDFHKIRHEGKQEAYKQDFFDILSPKDLKRIKRKPMGSEKVRNKKKQSNNSEESENDGSDMEDDFLQSDSEQRKSSQSESSGMREEMNIQLDDLQKKKVFLQTQIRKQQQENERLEIQNIKLKTVFNNQNTQFYHELLKILQSLIISQFNSGQIKRSTYDKIVRQIYEEKERLNETKKENHGVYDILKRQEKMQKVKYFQESKFLTLVKELLNSKKETLTIPTFIQTLLYFIQNENPHLSSNPIDGRPDPLFMNYDPYYIPNQKNSRESQKMQKQSYQEKNEIQEKIKKSDHFKNESKESKSITIIKDKIPNDSYKQIKIKKRNKRKDSNSDDEEYLPKNHR